MSVIMFFIFGSVDSTIFSPLGFSVLFFIFSSTFFRFPLLLLQLLKIFRYSFMYCYYLLTSQFLLKIFSDQLVWAPSVFIKVHISYPCPDLCQFEFIYFFTFCWIFQLTFESVFLHLSSLSYHKTKKSVSVVCKYCPLLAKNLCYFFWIKHNCF